MYGSFNAADRLNTQFAHSDGAKEGGLEVRDLGCIWGCVFSIALTFWAPVAIAEEGPFGVSMGDDISKFTQCTKSEKLGWYECSSLPKSHSAFEYYTIKYHDDFGVCFVKGIGKEIDDNGYGTSTRLEAERISSQISKKYGKKYKHEDILFPGALWDDPDEWLMSLRQKERIFYFKWSSETGYNKISKIETIIIIASAISRNTGYITIDFYFENNEECKKAIELNEGDAF